MPELSSGGLHGPVLERASKEPDRTAVVTVDRTLSYAELVAEAAAVAHWLRDRGVAHGALVGVRLARGWRQVAAVLGVLWVGAAYLPLEVGWPRARRDQLVELAQPDLVLELDGGDATPWADCAGSPAAGRPGRLEPEPAPVRGDDLAYVIYTSGSTGTPKGVAVDHGAALNTIVDVNRRLAVGSVDRMLGCSSLTFDLSVYDIFGVLGAGGRLVMPPPGAEKDPAAWANMIRGCGVTLWNSVPALMQMLVDYVEGASTTIGDSLRLVLLSGDWIPISLPDRIRTLAPQAKVVSLGGATEAAIWSIAYPIDRVDPEWRSIPYGRALANQTVLVLDEEQKPCPAGVPGELYIGGRGLARGYWRDPQRTAERFVRRPGTGERLYRTGDRGVREPDGVVRFLGRMDLQVKLHGYRVELGEVETVLAQHPAVAAAAATAPETGGSRRLVGHVALLPQQVVTAAQLREFLALRLPDYLVPAAVVIHDRLPLTGNGKVDRLRLERHSAQPEPAGGEATAPEPSTEAERMLVTVCADVLHRPSVPLDRSFVEAGGHSLLAAQVAGRLRARLAREVPVSLLLRGGPLSAVAAELEGLRQVDGALALPPLAPRCDPGAPAALSAQQEEIWFLKELAGGNRAYHFQCTVHFTGDLRVELLERALAAVVDRHEILRTTFVEGPDGVRRVVAPAYRTHLPVVDLTVIPAEERASALERIVAEEVGSGLDPTRLPLIKWKLLRFSPTEHVLVQVEHHLVHDGWSLAVLWGDIEQHYTVSAKGEQPALGPSPVQYGDYVAWQRVVADSQHRSRSLRYWAERLRDLPEPIEMLPTGSRPARQTFHGYATRVQLDPHLYRDLRAFARRESASMFATMCAVFAVLVHRYTGATDLPLGSAVANRPPGAERLVGMLVNTIVLRLAANPTATFRELLSHTGDVVVEALEHQEVPFPEVVRTVAPARDPSRNPLVQTCFSFHDSAVPELDWPGVSGRIVERSNHTAKFDLNVIVVPRAEQRAGARDPLASDGLALLWEYNTDLYDETAIAAMIGHYQTLLADAIRNPDAPIARLAMLTGPERAALAAWNATERPGPADDLVSLVRGWARRTPDALALAAGEHTLSYRQLVRRSDAQAARLAAALPTEPNGVIPLFVGRGPDLIIAMLAALTVGCPYSVLDPSDPAGRAALILRDLDARVVVTQQDLLPSLPADRPSTLLVDEPADLPDRTAPPVGDGSLAYVLYTSGSTGTPKGVEVNSAAVANYCAWQRRTLAIDASDRASQLAAPTFDGSNVEIWPYLTAGASIHFADDELRFNPARLLQWVRSNGITRMFAPTPIAELLLSDPDITSVPLRTLMTGGDVLRRRPPAGAPFHLFNMYGPTETTIASTYAVVEPGDPEGRIPVGHPIDNTTVHVLDAAGEPVPVGVTGEVHIGGDGVAGGYHGQPELTAASFVTDPFAGRQGARLYRTGDLARRNGDGSLVILGRRDGQVKVRGFRVELGEVEAAVLAEPGVAHAVARAWRANEAGRDCLVAYVVPEPGTRVDPDAHRVALARRLPGYMVPTDVVRLAELPLTAHGKVDRQALPAPATRTGAARPAEAVDHRTSLTDEELLLCRLWSEMLGVERVDPGDDFYALGGHSLAAMRISARLRQEHGKTLPVSTILDRPTVAQLAELIRARS